jgi:adenosine deaminase
MKDSKLLKLPKVEFHRHLDGSVRLDTIIDLAKHNNIDLGETNKSKLFHKLKITEPMKSLQAVLDCFWTTQSVMANYDAIKRVAFENVEDAYRDGIVLSELRFAPTFISKNKDLQNDEIIEAVRDGMNEAMKKYDIQAGLIFIAPRSLSLEDNHKALDDYIKYAKDDERLVGFDMADTENDYDTEGYKALTQKAIDSGLHITVHSGEDTTAEHVKFSIEELKAERIGHGIQIHNSPEVIELVKERNVPLEVCVTSNWLTNSVTSIEAHPIKKLYEAGVQFSINTDDPHIMNIDLVHEYALIRDKFGFSMEDFHKINKASVSHSFLNKDIQDKVLKTIS